MKRFSKIIVLLSTLGLLVAAAAQAEVTSNTKVPVVINLFIPCANGGAGETVSVSGDLHVLMTLTVNGNHFSAKYHFQPQGISGVGLVTGDKYLATGVTQENASGSFVNGEFTDTFVNNFRMIGQGPGNNFLYHENAHITFNANGIVTAFVDNITTDCK